MCITQFPGHRGDFCKAQKSIFVWLLHMTSRFFLELLNEIHVLIRQFCISDACLFCFLIIVMLAGSDCLILGSVDSYGHLIVSKLDNSGKGNLHF